MSNAVILPFRFEDYAERLSQAVAETGAWVHQAKIAAEANEGTWRRRVTDIGSIAAELSAAIDKRVVANAVGDVRSLNDRLARLEQTLADDDGSAETRWYRHVFYGWNIYSLYDGQMLPGLAEALRVRDEAGVSREGLRITRALDRMESELKAALAEASGK
jgi:hypothetical protein